MLAGPLSNHENYLIHIALANFCEYNSLVQYQEEKGLNKTPAQYKRLRYFLNTIESLNNVLEYFFHDVKEAQGWKDKELNNILGKIRNKHKILRDIEQIANGYKHCIRRDNKNLQASDMHSSTVIISLDENGIRVDLGFDSIVDDNLMRDAWKFWLGYRQDPNIEKLLP